jgi:hypothetical protein
MILYQICWWWFLLCFLHELLMSSLKCESAWTTCALIKSEKPNARMPALARMGQWTCMNILNGLKAWKFFVFQNARSAWLNSSMWDVETIPLLTSYPGYFFSHSDSKATCRPWVRGCPTSGGQKLPTILITISIIMRNLLFYIIEVSSAFQRICIFCS